MANYVLVHGAWHGGWCYRDTAAALRNAADGWDPSFIRYFAEKFANDPSWRAVKMPSSHEVMVDLPEDLAEELVALA